MESLRLLMWAAEQGGNVSRERLADELSVGHFEKQRCVCDPKVQLAAVSVAGLDVDAARDFLASTRLRAEVAAKIESVSKRAAPSLCGALTKHGRAWHVGFRASL